MRRRAGRWAGVLRRLLPGPVAELDADGRVLLATRALRLFAAGFLSVLLAVYLPALGLAPAALGAVFTAALVGSAVTTVFVAALGDRVCRRRLLMLTGGLMAAAGAAFALTDAFWLLLLAAFIGVLSPGGGDVGSTLALEQAALAQILPPDARTGVFAWTNLVASAATAVGALAAGAPVLIQHAGIGELDAYRLAVWAYVGVSVILVALFSRLSPAVEAAPAPPPAHRRLLGLHRSRGLVARFALLLALNAFAAGFVVQAFVAYFFAVRFGADLPTLGLIFFLTNLAGALSYPVAARIAGRIGLINTMVFTQLPSNLLLMLVPLMPTLPLAAAVLILRHALSQMDRPAREAYTMAVVAPDERTAAAGLLSIATDAASAMALSLAGLVAQFVAPGAPFLIAGVGRILYNGALFLSFRKVALPEKERAR